LKDLKEINSKISSSYMKIINVMKKTKEKEEFILNPNGSQVNNS